jgi:BirA family biotin operon repressor/biotin-[acetyl-CoA-carboxylase] ligase
LAGLTVAETLNKVNADISIKWPNDLLINSKKVGGIISTVHGDGVIIGIGINVSMAMQELPVAGATSLGIEGVSTLDRNVLLSKILGALEIDFTRWDLGESVLARYLDLSATVMSNIRIELPDGRELLGKAISIDEQGQLHLDDGQVVSVGDVIHLR